MIQFEVGKTYSCTSVCDSNCKWLYTVTKRTAKTITIQEKDDNAVTRKINVWSDTESIMPMGTYSMAPILKADREVN